MNYEAWRISFQSSEQAARAAYDQAQRMACALDSIANMKNRDGVEIDMHREELRGIARSALKPNAELRGRPLADGPA